VTEAWFPSNLVLSPHLHDRAALVVMLEGSFDLLFSRRTLDCSPSSVFTEPVDEKHGNCFGTHGAHVLVLQPDHEHAEVLRPCWRIFEQIMYTQHEGLSALAWRMAYELRTPDAVSVLTLQGLGLEMMASMACIDAPQRLTPPAWVRRVEERIREEYLNGIDINDLAETADVHPAHLARVFRKYYRKSIGLFTRHLRLDWAMQRLATSKDAISGIAMAAGFADQSHFTRQFKSYTGFTPGRFRKAIKK